MVFDMGISLMVELLWAALLVIGLGYWGWAGVQIVRLNGKIREITEHLKGVDARCEARERWMDSLDSKLDIVAGDTREIKGILKGRNDVPKT